MNSGFTLWLFFVSMVNALGGMLGIASGIFIVPIHPFGHVEIHTAMERVLFL